MHIDKCVLPRSCSSAGRQKSFNNTAQTALGFVKLGKMTHMTAKFQSRSESLLTETAGEAARRIAATAITVSCDCDTCHTMGLLSSFTGAMPT